MKWKRVAWCVAVLVAGAAMAYGQSYDPDNFDVYKYSQPEINLVPVPDVDKAFHGHVGLPTCWQAAAANVLGAAGYGIGAGPGATPQQRADYIYTQLTNDLGTMNAGFCEQAVNYWLYTYGKNPDNITNPGQPNKDFMPDNPYTDVTVERRPLALNVAGAPNDYDFLLDELRRCQYVNVSFEYPEHCMTLVGGNYWNNPNNRPDGNKSIWHDNCRDLPDTVVNVDDDVFTNAPDANGFWTLNDYVTTKANGYMILCPGLEKPLHALLNYDVAYYRSDADNDGKWDPVFRVAGQMGGMYQGPGWIEDNIVQIGNEHIPDWRKDVWLLVDYIDRVPGRQENITLRTQDSAGVIVTLDPTSVTPSDDNGQLLLHWGLDWQPAWEQIIFPDARYKNLYDPTGQGPWSNVKDWDVATYCEIPEPTTLLLLGTGMLAAIGMVWRRRLS